MRCLAYDAVPVACSLVFSVGVTGVALGVVAAVYRRFDTLPVELAMVACTVPSLSARLVRLYDRVVVGSGLASESAWTDYQRTEDPLYDVCCAAIGLATRQRRLREYAGARLPPSCFADSALGNALYYVLVGSLACWAQSHCRVVPT